MSRCAFPSIAIPAEGLQIAPLGLPPLVERLDVVDFELGLPGVLIAVVERLTALTRPVIPIEDLVPEALRHPPPLPKDVSLPRVQPQKTVDEALSLKADDLDQCISQEQFQMIFDRHGYVVNPSSRGPTYVSCHTLWRLPTLPKQASPC